MSGRPEFLELSTSECRDVIERNHVGRLAFVHGRDIDIEPLGYVHKGEWLFLRSAYGAKIEALAHNPFVAFEVDEVRGPFDWRSVVAHGTIYPLPSDGSPQNRAEHARALAAIREIVPSALRAGDPTPERQIVYGMHVDRLSGRMAHGAPRQPLFETHTRPAAARRRRDRQRRNP